MNVRLGGNALIALTAFLLLLSAGCIVDEGHIDPRPGSGEVDTYFTYESDPRYSINGTIYLELYVEEEVTFENVTVCGYDQTGRVLNATNVGSFQTPASQQPVELSFDRRPRYVVVDHPDFVEHSLASALVEWSDEFVREAGDAEEYIDEFEYRSPSTPGECGSTS